MRNILLVLLLVAAGCTSRPISDPYESARNPFYRGELTEFDLIGAGDLEQTRGGWNTAQGAGPQLPDGSRIILIQSGAFLPDEALARAFGRHYEVSPFTGNRFLRGRYDVDGRPLFVTSGIGTSLVAWRLGVVPEVVELSLLALSGGEC